MPATRVQSRWNAGQLEFLDMNGNVICTYNGTAREFDFPQAGILSIAGVPVTATAAELNSVSAAITVRNDTGVAMDQGDLVRITGYNVADDVPEVELAGLDEQATHVLTEDIDDGETGQADEEALVGGLATNGIVVGTLVYLDAAGAFTDAIPTGADEIAQTVGVVVVEDVAPDGVVLFFPGYPVMGRIGTSQIQNEAITAAKIPDAEITMAKLAGDADLTALISAGNGAVNTYNQADGAGQAFLAADPARNRSCLVVAVVTTALLTTAEFAVVDPGPVTFLTIPTLAAIGSVHTGIGTLASTEALTVNCVGGDAGDVMIMVLALETA